MFRLLLMAVDNTTGRLTSRRYILTITSYCPNISVKLDELSDSLPSVKLFDRGPVIVPSPRTE